MKRQVNVTVVFFLLAALCLSICVEAQSTTPQQMLQQYVADLQKNPNDTALCEKIIALVRTMKSAPPIPEAAREHYVMATTFVEAAKDNSAYEHAIEHYKAALQAAPWWADVYKKLAIAQKAAAHYDDAISTLNLYLLTQPADARDAQDEIYKLKALKQSSAEDQTKKQREEQQRAWESSPEGIAAKKQKEQEAWLKKLDGARYTLQFQNTGQSGWFILDIRGTTLVKGITCTGNCPGLAQGQYREFGRAEIRGREAKYRSEVGSIIQEFTFRISEDGSEVDETIREPSYSESYSRTQRYYRER